MLIITSSCYAPIRLAKNWGQVKTLLFFVVVQSCEPNANGRATPCWRHRFNSNLSTSTTHARRSRSPGNNSMRKSPISNSKQHRHAAAEEEEIEQIPKIDVNFKPEQKVIVTLTEVRAWRLSFPGGVGPESGQSSLTAAATAAAAGQIHLSFVVVVTNSSDSKLTTRQILLKTIFASLTQGKAKSLGIDLMLNFLQETKSTCCFLYPLVLGHL